MKFSFKWKFIAKNWSLIKYSFCTSVYSMSNQNVFAITKQINNRFVRLRDRARRSRNRKEHRLGSDEFLPLRTTRAADPGGGAGKTINRHDVSRRTGSPEGRRDLELRSDDAVGSGADSRISELSQRAGLQVPEIGSRGGIGLPRRATVHGGIRYWVRVERWRGE